MFDLKTYLIEALEGFKRNPADTEYQEGYEAALAEILKVAYPEE